MPNHHRSGALSLTDDERSTLLARAAGDSQKSSVRSRIVLGCADGLSTRDIAAQVGTSPSTVAKWRQRFVEHGIDGLADAPRPGRPRRPGRGEVERLVTAAVDEAGKGAPVPTTRSLARSVGVSQSTIARIWRQHRHADGTRSALAAPAGSSSPTAHPPARGLLSEHVYQLLRHRIVNGELVAGQRLVEAEVARQLGTSQAPAREAIKKLAYEGLVSSVPHRGSAVAEISEAQARELREMRILLEEYAARRVAAGLEPRFLRLLVKAVDAMRVAGARGDVGAFRDADMEFHRNVCAASGNSFLLRLWRTIEPSLWGLHVVSNPRYTGDWSVMAERHDELLTVLSRRDPDGAAHAFAAHAGGDASGDHHDDVADSGYP